MNETVKKLKAVIKKPKTLLILGIIGIAMIFISSFFPSKSESDGLYKSVSAEEYKEDITESVKKIVTSVTGDKSPTVVVTLESGVRYTYADSGETDTTETAGGNTSQNSKSSKRSYITVKDSAGSEKPLIITENMPQIRGVAVICEGGNDPEISENVKNAVIAALNITTKRVYVSGGTS